MNRIYSFALLKSFYDEGKDYIDAFQPLLVSSLPPNGGARDISQIKDGILSSLGLDIPEMAVQVVASRAKRRGSVYRKDRRFGLTNQGKQERPDSHDDRDVNRRVNAFAEDARQYIATRGVELSREEVWLVMERFVATNLEFFEQFVGVPDQAEAPIELDTAESALLEYCCWIEDSRPEQFRTLRDIVLGSVIASSVYTASFSEVGRKFDRTLVFLDSNILFNLLELHYDIFSRPVLEMYRLMKSMGSFEFRVFDFTIEEMIAVLRNFGRRSGRYVPGVKVNSIVSSLKSKGWTRTQVRQYIAEIDDHLAELGISVEATNIDLENYVPPDGEQAKIEGYKPGQILQGQNHDLAAIHEIRRRRKHAPRQLERAGVFFLSADRRLARFNFIEHRHRERVTVSEVVPASVLTTFLWLKDPERAAEIPLRSIIVMHSRELLVDREVWNRFFDTVKALRRSGRISREDASVLIYEPRLEEELRLTRPRDISDAWVLQGAREAKDRLVREFEEQADERIRDLSRRFEAELTDQERALRGESSAVQNEQEKRFYEAIGNMRERVKNESETRTRNALAIAGVVASLAILGIVVWMWNALSPVAGAISFAILFIAPTLALTLSMSTVRDSLHSRVFNRIFRRKIAASRLSELEAFLTDESD